MAYDGDAVELLENRDAVRQRPGMYIGDVGKDGFHHLVYEIVDNSVDEALNGHASVLTVTLHEDEASVTVTDDGRGIPVDTNKKTGLSALELVFTKLHAGGKFASGGAYKTSGGLHGVGASVVNFLSSRLEVEVRRDGTVYRQTYRQGMPEGPVTSVGTCAKRDTGTKVHFIPDPEIFGEQLFDVAVLREVLEIKTYLNKGLKVVFQVEKTGESEVFLHEEGLLDYLEHLERDQKAAPVHTDPIYGEYEQEGLKVEYALKWTESTREVLHAYANTIYTPLGGTHANGTRMGVRQAIRSYLEASGMVPKTLKISSEDIQEGLIGLVSVFVEADLQIQSQTKDKLNNPEVQPFVTQAVKAGVENFLLSNSATAQVIGQRVIQAAKARAASRSAATLVKRKRGSSRRLSLPGKLADCSSNDPSECELFIVEGDSAGGNAKQARDRKTQAILPLRGKVLNAESATLKQVAKNKELGDIVEALGCGIGPSLDLSKLRYHRIVLLMDADSDGAHICALLLTFFWRYMPELIFQGHVYLAQPPLYKVTLGKTSQWVLDDEELAEVLTGVSSKPEISRFKGLGEMEKEELKETALNPSTRVMVPVEVDDRERVENIIQALMGRSAASRHDLIVEHMQHLEHA